MKKLGFFFWGFWLLVGASVLWVLNLIYVCHLRSFDFILPLKEVQFFDSRVYFGVLDFCLSFNLLGLKV